MRVRDLQQVNSIDQEIMALQQQLTTLYQTRATLFDATVQPVQENDENDEVALLYRTLTAAWERYDITPPQLSTLRPLIKKALAVKSEWEATQPVMSGALQVLLVPPARLMGIPAHPRLRKMQRLLQGADRIDPEVKIPRGRMTWRVLVVYAQSEGLPVRSEAYSYSNEQAAALGMQEYVALTLQLSQPIDVATWTSFMNKNDDAVIYAGCRRGRYQFGINDIHGALDDDRVRPAIEVKK